MLIGLSISTPNVSQLTSNQSKQTASLEGMSLFHLVTSSTPFKRDTEHPIQMEPSSLFLESYSVHPQAIPNQTHSAVTMLRQSGLIYQQGQQQFRTVSLAWL